MSEASFSRNKQYILIALYKAKEHCLFSDELIRETGVGFSSLASSQRTLIASGLLQKLMYRCTESDRISKKMSAR